MHRSFSNAIYRIDGLTGSIDIRASGGPSLSGISSGFVGGSGKLVASGRAKSLFYDVAAGTRFADTAFGSEAIPGAIPGTTSGAIVTACNPAGLKQSALFNRIADRRLRHLIRRLGLRVFRSYGIDPAGHWPDEPGFFIPGCGWWAAQGLALAFRQKAFLWITRHSAIVVFVSSPGTLKPWDVKPWDNKRFR